MPRRASEGPQKAQITIELLVANVLTTSEMRHQVMKDLENPDSEISRYLTRKFGYRSSARSGYCKVSSNTRRTRYASLNRLLGIADKEEPSATQGP